MRRRWRWRWTEGQDVTGWQCVTVLITVAWVTVMFATAHKGNPTTPGWVLLGVFLGWVLFPLVAAFLCAGLLFVREHSWPLERATEPVLRDLREARRE